LQWLLATAVIYSQHVLGGIRNSHLFFLEVFFTTKSYNALIFL
jgi:hypothetical protein